MIFVFENKATTKSKGTIISILFCVATFILPAQQSAKTSNLATIEIKNVPSDQLTVKYDAGRTIESFLLFITDNDGNNIFLESKHRLAVPYFKQLDLSHFKKGSYFLTVISDDEKLIKTITIK